MRATIRLLPLTLLVLLALLFAACGGAKGSDDVSDSPAATEESDGSSDADSTDDGDSDDGDSDDDTDSDGSVDAQPGAGPDSSIPASDGVAVLGASAESFVQEITSMEGGIEMQMAANGADIAVTLDFAFQSPDKMWMAMQMSGDAGQGVNLDAFGNMEFLIRDNTYYINSPLFGGWVYMSIDEMGLTDADLQEIQAMLDTSSAFDYEALVDALGGVDFVGEEQLNGLTVLHYSISVDAEDVLASLGGLDASGMGVDQLPVDGVSGPIQMDIWVGAEDILPYKLTLDMDASVPGQGSSTVHMLMHIDSYNGDVSIPPPPANAQSLEDAFGGLFGDLEGGTDGWDDFLGPQ